MLGAGIEIESVRLLTIKALAEGQIAEKSNRSLTVNDNWQSSLEADNTLKQCFSNLH
jgi:hypothetical protein